MYSATKYFRSRRKGNFGAAGRYYRSKGKADRRIKQRISRLESTSKKECKKHDELVGPIVVTNTGFVNYLTQIAQGDQSIQREGLSINLLSIYMKGFCLSSKENPNGIVVRLILFRDKYQLGVLPSVTDLLETANVFSFTEHDEMRRFVVLWDKMLDISAFDTGLDRTKILKYYKSFKKSKKIDYRGTTNGIASAGSGALFLLAISNSASNHPELTMNYRFKFTG